MERVGLEIAQDPDLAKAIIEPPKLQFVDEADDLGSVAVMRGKVVAGDRWRVATAIRLRLDQALKDEGIRLNRLVLANGRES